MALVVQVPLNTVLADLDEGLADAAPPRARAPRVRGRRDRVRRAVLRLGGPAHRAGGQPLPLRPARVLRGPGPHADARRATRNGSAHDAAAAAARGHLRDHRVDAGGRGRAPPALAGARRAVLVPQPPRRGARRPPRQQRPPPDRGHDRPAADREGRLLDLGRRALQGVARLRRARDASSPAPSSRAAPRCARSSCARASATARRGAVERAAPLRRQAPRRRRRSRSPTRGSRCPTPGAGRRPTATGRFIFDRIVPGKHHVVARTLDGGDGGSRRRDPRPAPWTS